MNFAQSRRRAVAVAMGIAVVGALAACSDDSNDASDDTAAPETVTETVTAGQGADQNADQTTSQNDPAQTTGAAPAQGSGSVSTLVFNGNDSAAQFPNVQCRQDDDGELEIELRGDTRGDGVDIDLDLDLRGEPRVEGMSVDLDRVEWESTDAQEREATVEVDGDTYRVNGQVQIDDDDPNAGEVADLEAEVSCA